MKYDVHVRVADAIRATQDRITSQAELAGVHPGNTVDQLRGVRRTAAHIADLLDSRELQTEFLKLCGYGGTTMNPRDPALDLRPLPRDGVKAMLGKAQD